jgi:hypothetical protein
VSVRLCSLGFKPVSGQEQVIPPGAYTLLRFPYGTQENADPWDMHSRVHAGRVVTYADPESGLIIPSRAGVGCLELDVIWTDTDYTELRDVFVRDPLGTTPDPTGYDHRARTPGENCFTKTHWLVVRPGIPLGVEVAHDGTVAAKVRMAQFKLTIFGAEDPPPERPNAERPGATDPWPDM